ncbi:hypothetical protein EAG_01755 [Camponotus floridanus]|uniref:Uncharacterized protein n=1 Tax=Camponotus floridanus TaxID=104421 RepID=E2AX52_CAMFO|nr:hypothetical protein EAG_01755 [Camponotus floridanus]
MGSPGRYRRCEMHHWHRTGRHKPRAVSFSSTSILQRLTPPRSTALARTSQPPPPPPPSSAVVGLAADTRGNRPVGSTG